MPASLFSQIQALNKQLTLNQKLSILALSLVILFGVFFFAYMVQKEPYQLLFSEMDAANANSVVEQLKQMEIPYRLDDGGRSILVPADRVDGVRIDMASHGLPTVGRLGYEVFDQSNLGITDFAQKVNYQRALEGELERTILSLNEIEQARVHLVMRKNALFEKDNQPAKASVVVKLRNLAGLNKRRMAGICNLVAFAVEGLEPHNVTVLDVSGTQLSDSTPENESLTDSQASAQRKFERELIQKVVALLGPIVGGEDNVRVSASVQLDFSETTEKTERVLDPVIVSQQTSQEMVQSPGRQGIPFRANDAGANQDPASATVVQDGRSLQTETTNYEVSKTIRQTVVPSGGVLRQSVAVVVNDKTVPGGDGNAETAQPRTPEEMDRLRSLVAATAGINLDRGDTLEVENVSFTEIRSDEMRPQAPSLLEQYKNFIYPAARYLLVLVLFVLFYLMIFRPVKNRVFAFVELEKPNQLASSMQDPALLKHLESALSSDRALTEGELSAIDPQSALKKEILRLAKENPQAITHLVRSWLSEGA